jgi:hypothetical protein
MKPKNKLQAEVLSLSNKLYKINRKIEKWAFNNVIEHKAFRTKKRTSCLSCGHQWDSIPSDNLTDKCPSCKRTVNIEDTLKKKYEQMVYVAMLETKDRFQVNRFFQLRTLHFAGEKPGVFIHEITQQWIEVDSEKTVIVSKNCGGMGVISEDHWSGTMEIKQFLRKYNVFTDAIHPDSKVMPIFQRNGFTPDVSYCRPFDLLMMLKNNSIAETLIKSGQYDMVRYLLYRENPVKNYWDSIKICIRNKYTVQDSSDYLDYLDLLVHFGKDIRNPKYICPDDLHKAHAHYVKKKSNQEKKIALEKQKRKINEANAKYLEEKKAFFGLAFTDGDLTVKVLESVNEFLEESEVHKHCVFTNSYYNKPGSLILSAQIGGQRVETIEISLTEMKPLQSRGFENKPTIHNQRIISLVNKNIRKIKTRYKKQISEVA